MSGDGPHDTITEPLLETALAAEVCRGLVDRTHEAALLVLALLSGEHALLVGASGMGKTLLARRLAACVHGARVFEHTLDAGSLVEDVLGPLSWPALEAGRHERLLAGHAAEAELVVLDEVHEASGALLDALRSLIDDRRVRVGARMHEAPLRLAIGTIRQPIEGSSALLERFLFTIPCGPVTAIEPLLEARDANTPPSGAQRVTTITLDALRQRAERVELGLATRIVLVGLADALTRAGIVVSNGRWQRIARAVRIQAASRGRERATLADLWFVPNALTTESRALATAGEAFVLAARSLTEGAPALLAARASALTEAVTAALRATELATNAAGAALFRDEVGTETTLHAHTRHLVDGEGRPLYHPPHELGSRIRKLTFEDLWELHFQRLPGGMARLKAYVSSPTNQILEETPREPVRRPKRHAKAAIEGFVTTAAELEREISALARALAAREPRGDRARARGDRAPAAERTVSEDRLLLRGAACPIGTAALRGNALARMREDLLRGRLEPAPLLAWLGPSVGHVVFEACVCAGLPSRCRARRDEAEEAISCVLDCLERALPMHDLANARGETSIAVFVIEQTLEAGLVVPRRSTPSVSACVSAPSPSTSTRRTPRRPLESIERLRSLRAPTR